ncbi:tripartite-type tricarboxylate transporter receptor subunit TctC [Shinella sp. BE166]|uniref:Bug family tripartite tricarboxylate transporter substrate binding protein n=1 Tax=Shinella sp. BE166 TaxID=3373918 RepID=UPI003EBDFBE9
MTQAIEFPAESLAGRGAAPLQVVVGFSPGSASDDIANLMAPAIGRESGRAVEIHRIQGEDGARAARFVAASKDADVLMIATLGTHALLPNAQPEAGYDPIEDFTPVILLAQAPMVLATGASSPYRTLGDVLAACRAGPGRRSFAASATVGAPFLATQLFGRKAHVDLNTVIYDQTNELYADLAAGRVDFSFNNLMSMLPRIRRGELHALAVTSPTRIPLLPDVPSVAEMGMPDCVVLNWLGLVGSKSLPSQRAEMLNAACRSALAFGEIASALERSGLSSTPGSADGFGRFMHAERVRWDALSNVGADELGSVAILSQS